MFWLLLMTMGFGLTFAKLGSLSVWVNMLSAALNIALLSIVVLVLMLVWRNKAQEKLMVLKRLGGQRFRGPG